MRHPGAAQNHWTVFNSGGKPAMISKTLQWLSGSFNIFQYLSISGSFNIFQSFNSRTDLLGFVEWSSFFLGHHHFEGTSCQGQPVNRLRRRGPLVTATRGYPGCRARRFWLRWDVVERSQCHNSQIFPGFSEWVGIQLIHMIHMEVSWNGDTPVIIHLKSFESDFPWNK